MNKHATYQQLRSHLAYLKLTAAAEQLPAALEHAEKTKPGYTQFLHDLLDVEVNATQQRRLASRLRLAGFPSTKTLEEFDFSAQPSLDRRLLEELATLRFIEEKANLLAIGPPGVGKTMLAIALGLKAVHAGYRVYYTTAADLVARTSRAALEGRWQTTMRFWNGPQLLVIDELGYLPMPGEAASPSLPGHLAPLRARLDHPDDQPRHRISGARSSKTAPSPPRSSTASCTTPPSCRSTATATACAATAPASRPSEPASTTPPRVGNSHDRNWGILTIVDTDPKPSTSTPAFADPIAAWSRIEPGSLVFLESRFDVLKVLVNLLAVIVIARRKKPDPPIGFDLVVRNDGLNRTREFVYCGAVVMEGRYGKQRVAAAELCAVPAPASSVPLVRPASRLRASRALATGVAAAPSARTAGCSAEPSRRRGSGA